MNIPKRRSTPFAPHSTRMAESALRYIVLAPNMRMVDNFRRARGLRQRDVIGVTPATARYALRGLCGPVKVITLESWNPTPEIHARVQRDLEIIRATTPAGSTHVPDYKGHPE